MCWFLFKRPRTTAPWTQAMAALGRSVVRLEQDLETVTTGEMGILVRPAEDQDGLKAQAELERALSGNDVMRLHTYRIELDSGGFPWVILRANTLQDLTAAAFAAGDVLVRLGIGPRVVAGVFPFRWKDRRLHWLYQPRVRGFTPFVPLGKTEADDRDHPLEVRMAGAMHNHIPVVRDIAEWYPVWDLPFQA